MSQKYKSSEILRGSRTHIVRFGPYAHIFKVKDSSAKYLGVVEHEMFATHNFSTILDCLHAKLLIESRNVYIGDQNRETNNEVILLGKRSNSLASEGLEPRKGFRIRHKHYKVERNRLNSSEFNQYLEQKIMAKSSTLVILKRQERSRAKKRRVREVVYSLRQGHVVIEDEWGVNETLLISKTADGRVALDSLKELNSSGRTVSLRQGIGHVLVCTNAPNNERVQLLFVGPGGYRTPKCKYFLAEEKPIEPIVHKSWDDGCYVQFGHRVFIICKEVCQPIAEIDLSKLFVAKYPTLDCIQNLLNEDCAVSHGFLRIGDEMNGLDMGSVHLSANRVHIAADGKIMSLKTEDVIDNIRTLVEDTDNDGSYGVASKHKFELRMVEVERYEDEECIPIDMTGARHSIWLSEGSTLFIATKVNDTAKLYMLRQNGHVVVDSNLIVFESDAEGSDSAVICKRHEAKNIQLLSGSHLMIVGTNGNLLFTDRGGLRVYDWSIEAIKRRRKRKIRSKEFKARKKISKKMGNKLAPELNSCE